MELEKDYTWNEKELQEFRMVVLKEKQLKCRTDDMFLLSFLRARKYDKDRALKLLKNYYSTRKKYPNISKNLKPSALETALETNTICCSHLETGQILGFVVYSNWDTTQVNLIDLIRCILLYADLEINNHALQVNGVHIIVDAKKLSWRHLIQYTPSVVYSILSCLYHSFPVSIKGIHVVNVNKYLHALLTIFLPFLPYKLKQRIHYYGSNMENLHKIFHPKHLPAELGGELPPLYASKCNQWLRDNEEFFIENEKYWTEDEKFM